MNFDYKRQTNYNIITTKNLIRVSPIIIILIFISYVEWQVWKANSRRQMILNTQHEAICEPNDIVCRQCPFFRGKVLKMNACVRRLLDERINNEDVGYVVNSIPYSIAKCNLKWTMTQRVIQMIKDHDTQLVLPPTNSRTPITALVLGADKNFEMEQQLVENRTKVHFYGSNFENAETAIRFKKRLNGTQLHKDLKFTKDNERNTTLLPKQFFQKYFPRRPLDIVFLHLDDITYELIDQLMGRGMIPGFLAIQHPVCQINVDIPLPSKLADARKIVKWFRQLNTGTKALQQQYLIGYSTIIMEKSEMRLRFYAINVGQTKCVAKFLNRSECRSLIGSIYDE